MKKKKMSTGKRDRSLRMAFRYQEEVLTYYNKSVRRFVQLLFFFYVMVNLLTFSNEPWRIKEEWIYILVGLVIIAAFAIYIYWRTKKFTQRIHFFTEDNRPHPGQIVDFVMGPEGKPALVIRYTKKGASGTKEFVTPPVTANPYEVLSSPKVDVYEREGEALAVNFRVARDESQIMKDPRK
ncbi:MAG: hypothetical protein Q4E76_02485 [Tissierellia bacterium]|nr:hypothetical protein [Tissierellia bacterium]